MLANLARLFLNWIHKPCSQAQVDAFFEHTHNPFELRNKIERHGFVWKGETYWLDWNRTPHESLAIPDKKINCGDFLELYRHVYHKTNLNYQIFYLTTKKWFSWHWGWHYVSVFDWNGIQYVQSNNDLIRLNTVATPDKISERVLALFSNEYANIRQIQHYS